MLDHDALLFPAHAGMNRTKINENIHVFPVPRTRGDEPKGRYEEKAHPNCSPHTRG